MVKALDFGRTWQWNFQDAGSPVFEGIIDLHHNIFFILLLILGIVLYLLYKIIKDNIFLWINNDRFITYAKQEVNGVIYRPYKMLVNHIYRHNKYLTFNSISHGTFLEIVWTIIPSIILFAVAAPSFSLLYSMEEIVEPAITVKVLASQWYWSYEYGNMNIQWDSYMLPENELIPGQLRLLTVDNSLYLPVKTPIRLLISSKDVIHSFAIPSLGLKVDAVPGRLNQLSCYINRTGIYYGQCSELCGVNHGFMPIELVAFKFKNYGPFTSIGNYLEQQNLVLQKALQRTL